MTQTQTQGWFQKLTPKVIRNNPYLDMIIDNERGVPTMGKEFRVVTANVYFGLGEAKAREDITEALDLGDIVGFQELSSAEDRDRMADIAKAEGFRTWIPGNENGFAYRPERFTYDKGNVFLLGAAPIRGDIVREKYATVVVFIDKVTNRKVGVVNTHLVSKAFTKNPERLPYWERMLVNLAKSARWTDRYADEVIILGDMNANQNRPDIRRRFRTAFGKQIVLDNPDGGTFGMAIYDWVFRLDTQHTRRVGARIFRMNSDHNGVQVTYKWK